MTRIEDQLHTLHTVELPQEVKTRMRAELSAYAKMHTPSALVAPIRSPFFSVLSLRVYSGLALALILIVSVGGTAFAAENTLPGDILYPVKVGITEPIQTALVPSERGKAAWNAILAERRLEEAAQLAAANKLTPVVQTELAANFTAHVSASEAHAENLQNTGDTTGSLSAQSDLEARLTAHEHILGVIAAHYAMASSTDTTETTGALATLLTTVRDHQDAITSSRLALEHSISNSSTTTTSGGVASTTTTEIAIAHVMRFRHGKGATSARIAGEDAARTMEVDSILDHHAALLAKFLPIATTTATTTITVASTTTSTTSEEILLNNERDHIEEVKGQ